MQTCTQNPPRPFWRAAGEASAAHSLSLRWCLGRSRAWGAGTEFREPAPGEKRCSAGRVVRRLGPCSLPSRGSGRAFPGGAGPHTLPTAPLPSVRSGVVTAPGCLCAQVLGCIPLYVIPWTVARQAPLSMGFPRQEYWSGLAFPTPGESSQPMYQIRVSCVSCIGRWILYH